MKAAAVEMHEESSKSLLFPTYSRSSKPTRDRADKWGERSLFERPKHQFLMVQVLIPVKEINIFDEEAFLQVTGTQHCQPWPVAVLKMD